VISQLPQKPIARLPKLTTPADLKAKFNSGRWLERRQVDVPSCTAICGRYERETPVFGGFHTETMHFFDLSLAGRAADSRGRLVDCFREPQPLGDVLFVPAGYRYQGGGGQGTQTALFVFLQAQSLQEENAEVAEALASPRLRDFMSLRSDRIRFILTQISREMYNPDFGSELMVEGLATTLLVETARLLKQDDDRHFAKGGLAPVALRRIRDRVQDGCIPPTLEELAALCNLSRRHLMRAFRESTGQTIGQYIRHSMLERARHLLRETDLPVSMIAHESGFASAPAFSTMFRRHTGESPRDYRLRKSSFVRVRV
jgi:AraC family transcriptional regulator